MPRKKLEQAYNENQSCLNKIADPLGMIQSRLIREGNEVRYNKNQGCQKKIEESYNKNQGCLEKLKIAIRN